VVKTTPFGPTNDDVDHNNVEDLKNQLQHFIYEWAIYKEQNESLKRHIQEKDALLTDIKFENQLKTEEILMINKQCEILQDASAKTRSTQKHLCASSLLFNNNTINEHISNAFSKCKSFSHQALLNYDSGAETTINNKQSQCLAGKTFLHDKYDDNNNHIHNNLHHNFDKNGIFQKNINSNNNDDKNAKNHYLSKFFRFIWHWMELGFGLIAIIYIFILFHLHFDEFRGFLLSK